MPPDVLTYSLVRLQAVLDLVTELESSEFAQPNCAEAVTLIANELNDRRKILTDFDDQTDLGIVHQACCELLEKLFRLLPILGFFLRSSNVRNAFELRGPLARMAQKFVPKIKLVLSSEWEFSPLSYHQMYALPNYVLVGLPASESANGLALPLAGHELGHAVWIYRQLEPGFQKRAREELLKQIMNRWDEYHQHFSHVNRPDIDNLFGYRTWLPAHRWATSQLEECFCDQFGVLTFGDSYLRAFAYLLAPGLPSRNLGYPSNMRRARNIVSASERWGFPVPDAYLENFRDGTPNLDKPSEFLCSVADSSVDAITSEVLDCCETIGLESGVLPQNRKEVATVAASFRKLIPAMGVESLSSITHAGWEVFHEMDLWQNYPNVRERRLEVLNELVLKTVEVFDIETIRKSQV